jgi:Na+/phosphate symporter
MLIPAGYAINNTLSAFASGIFDRYQARVTWLFALAGMLIIIQLIESSPEQVFVWDSSTEWECDAGGV